MRVLGIDIGGTGVKGAVVRTGKGRLATDRFRIPTPHPATPDAVTATVARIVEHFDWQGPVGCTFPGVVRDGTVRTAANVDPAWIGTDAGRRFSGATGCRVVVGNDADAAGLAEARFGAARDVPGVVIVLTLGTGIGSALLVDGRLVPNTELGHLTLHGDDAERHAAESVRERLDLSWSDWAARVDEYLHLVERLFWPDRFVLGGGVSKKAEKFVPLLTCRTPVVAATLRNEAGIVGAACLADRSDGGTLRP